MKKLPASGSVAIVVANDPLVRFALQEIVSRVFLHTTYAIGLQTGTQAIQAASAPSARLIVLVEHLTDMATLDLVATVKRQSPWIQVVLMGSPNFDGADPDTPSRQRISRDASILEVTTAIRAAGLRGANGAGSVRDSTLMGTNFAAADSTALPLTVRQTELVKAVLDGSPLKTVARRLRVSEQTVRNALVPIYRRFNVSSRAELISAVHALAKEHVN